MLNVNSRVCVVGNGMAGNHLVERLAAQSQCHIDLVSAEAGGAYNRVQLSPLLAGDLSAAAVRSHNSAWYSDHGIQLHDNCTAQAINLAKRSLTISTGQDIHWDHLVLATGSTPVRPALPGVDLPGIQVFRTWADVDALRAAALANNSAVVLGGGLLGLEAADALQRLGMAVTLVHNAPWLLNRQLDRPAGMLLNATVRARGIQLCLAARCSGFLGERKVTGVSLASGRSLAAALVVLALGVQPETRLAAAAGLACDRGIVVNDSMATSAADVYAIGECIRHRNRNYGLVAPVQEQAEVLAAHLQGQQACYRGSSTATSLKVTGLQVFSAGDVPADPNPDTDELFEATDFGLYRRLVLRDGRLQGAVFCGDTRGAAEAAALCRSGAVLPAPAKDLLFGAAAGFQAPTAAADSPPLELAS